MPVGQADRAGVDDAPGVGEPVEGHVGMRGDHGLRGHAGERGLVAGDRAVHGDELVVVAGGGVAERHWPEPADVEGDAQRQAGQPVPVGPPDPGRAPAEVGSGRIGGQAAGLEGAIEGVGEPAVGVAPHPDRLLAEVIQAVQGLGGHGAIGQVAVKHDRIHSRGFHIAQDRLKRRQVAMNIGQHSHAHGSLLDFRFVVTLVVVSPGRRRPSAPDPRDHLPSFRRMDIADENDNLLRRTSASPGGGYTKPPG